MFGPARHFLRQSPSVLCRDSISSSAALRLKAFIKVPYAGSSCYVAGPVASGVLMHRVVKGCTHVLIASKYSFQSMHLQGFSEHCWIFCRCSQGRLAASLRLSRARRYLQESCSRLGTVESCQWQKAYM